MRLWPCCVIVWLAERRVKQLDLEKSREFTNSTKVHRSGKYGVSLSRTLNCEKDSSFTSY